MPGRCHSGGPIGALRPRARDRKEETGAGPGIDRVHDRWCIWTIVVSGQAFVAPVQDRPPGCCLVSVGECSVPLSNADRRRRWRDKRDALAKKAEKLIGRAATLSQLRSGTKWRASTPRDVMNRNLAFGIAADLAVALLPQGLPTVEAAEKRGKKTNAAMVGKADLRHRFDGSWTRKNR